MTFGPSRVWSKNGMHQIVDTGHADFDRQVDCIDEGNVWGRIQHSGYIRPYFETECNGFTSAPGHLRAYDLGPFRARGIPSHVLDFVQKMTDGYCSVILYQFFHWARSRDGRADAYSRRTDKPLRRVTHGYIVTTYDHELLGVFYTGPTTKSAGVIDTCVPYLCPDPTAPHWVDMAWGRSGERATWWGIEGMINPTRGV